MSKKIGLIDDSTVMRAILRKSILMCNYQVDAFLEAKNGMEGMTILKDQSNPLDIAFLDLHMPEMGGVEMLEKLRADGFSKVPIVVVSTSADTEMQNKCKELGAVGFIRKPFTPQDIGSIMAQVVGKPDPV